MNKSEYDIIDLINLFKFIRIELFEENSYTSDKGFTWIENIHTYIYIYIYSVSLSFYLFFPIGFVVDIIKT